jgi:hypothetical protein
MPAMGLEPRGCPQQILSFPVRLEVFGTYKNGVDYWNLATPHN